VVIPQQLPNQVNIAIPSSSTKHLRPCHQSTQILKDKMGKIFQTYPSIPAPLLFHKETNSMTAESTIPLPLGNNTVTTVLFKDILTNCVCLELFKDVCQKEFNLENVQFWLEVERFKLLFEEPVDKTRRNKEKLQIIQLYTATKLCEDFIQTNAPFEINVSFNLRNYIIAKFIPELTNTMCTSELFDAVQNEVYNVMLSDIYPRFIQTQQFELCKFILHADY
jgi:hypothetical protein